MNIKDTGYYGSSEDREDDDISASELQAEVDRILKGSCGVLWGVKVA